MENTCENDLASIDFSLAELYVEKGVNPVPSACDGFSFEIFDLPVKELSQKFIVSRENMQGVCKLLLSSKTIENQEALGLVLVNFENKINYMLGAEKKYKKVDFSFIELYNSLKVIQNSLGISVPSSELNVLSFMDEELNLELKKEEILKYVSRLMSFNNSAKRLYEGDNQLFIPKDMTKINQNTAKKIKTKNVKNTEKEEKSDGSETKEL